MSYLNVSTCFGEAGRLQCCKGEKGTGSEKKTEVLSRRNPRHRFGVRIKKHIWATVDLFPPRPLNAVSWFGRLGLRDPPGKHAKLAALLFLGLAGWGFGIPPESM